MIAETERFIQLNKTMIRVVNAKKRYYKISLHYTLIGLFCVDRIYGACRNKKPTGRKREYFEDIQDAFNKFQTTIKTKESKGYIIAW